MRLETSHTTTELIDEQKLPNPILPQVMRNAEQRHASQTRLRDHDVELEALVLIPLAPFAVSQLQHRHRKHHTDRRKHDQRQDQASRRRRRLVKPEERQKHL